MSEEQITVSHWPNDHFHRIKSANLDNVKAHAVYRFPRTMLRDCAIALPEVKRTSAEARNYEMGLHLFLQMAHVAEEQARNNDGKTMITVHPCIKMYLEWVPSAEEPDVAVEYRFHLFVFDNAINLGEALMSVIKEANKMHKTHISRMSNARGPDPMTGLKGYQSYLRVHEQIYYTTICAMARGDNCVANNLDVVMCAGVSIDDPGNVANPVNVFSLEHCIRNSLRDFPTKAQQLYQLTKQYKMGPDTYAFPDYDHVIRVSPFHFNPAEINKKYLPEYQMWLERNEPPPPSIAPPSEVEDEDAVEDMPEVLSSINMAMPDEPANIDNGFRPACFNQFETRSIEDLARERLSRFSMTSDTAIMAQRAKKIYKKEVMPFEGTDEFGQVRRNFQLFMTREMKSRCLNADAQISDQGKIIIAFIENLDRISDELPTSLNCSIEDLSVFATSVCRSYLYFENLFMVSTQHRPLYMSLMGRLDAYRHDHTLHWNTLQCGDGATSKSFVLDQMVACSIPGTVDQLTRQTMQADAVDGDKDDQITVFDELPPGMGASGNNKKGIDNTQAVQLKQKLTAQKVSTKTFMFDEVTGKRTCRISESSCIGVMFFATNDNKNDLDGAWVSRLYYEEFERIVRNARDIDDCVNGLRNMTENDKLNMRRAQNYFRIQQARVYLVENMIRVGIIKEPNMGVANILLQHFKEGLQRRGIQVSTARTWTRIKIMCRIQTICTALDTVFNCSDSPYVNVPFEYEQLLDIEPYLVCTEEILCFTLTMLSKEFYSPVEQKVLYQLYKMRKRKQNKFGNSERDISNDYIKLEPLNRLTKILQSSLSVTIGKTSQNNIAALFSDLSQKSFRTKSYRSISAEECGFPDINETTVATSQQCAHITYDAVYVHVGQLLKHQHTTEYDPVMETIQEMAFSSSKVKMMLTARAVSRNTPHILKMIKRVPSTKKLSHTNVLYNSHIHREFMGTHENVSETRKRRRISYDKDVDDIALENQCKKIGVTDLPVFHVGGLGEQSYSYTEFCAAAQRKSTQQPAHE